MTVHILDTDHLSLLQRKHPLVLQHLAEANLNQLAITIVTVEEQIKGHFNLIKRAKSGEQLIRAYATEILFKQNFTPIGPYDLQIAAIAPVNNLILVTHNTREFKRIEGLQLEDWEELT